jgi:ribonuclease HII
LDHEKKEQPSNFATKQFMRQEAKNSFEIEEKYLSEGYEFVIGVDEAGRGPLAGPVVAVAALRKFQNSNPNFQTNLKSQIQNHKQFDKKIDLIRDSKLLSEKQREEIYDFILENFHVGIGICDHKTIDRINILQATFLAMKKAITQLSCNLQLVNSNLDKKSKNPNYKLPITNCIILVDGNKIIPNCSYNQEAIISGDKIVKSISAASIIAKVTRDRIMREMHEKYPQYDFARHKGYGTALHREMIKKHGACEIHRKSFRLKSF